MIPCKMQGKNETNSFVPYYYCIYLRTGQKLRLPAKMFTAELATLFTRLEKVYDDDTRIRINDSIRFIIDSYAASDSVFEHRFTNIRYLGQITSSDNMLKIITWNLILTNSANRYFCYFIRKGEHGKKNIYLQAYRS